MTCPVKLAASGGSNGRDCDARRASVLSIGWQGWVGFAGAKVVERKLDDDNDE